MRAFVAIVALLVAGDPATAQQSEWDATQRRATRAELIALQDRYAAAARSSAYSDELRAEAAEQAERVRQRLELGDFPAGSRVGVWVEEQPAMTDTFTVSSDRSITLAGLGAVSLEGVLRSELQERIVSEVARIIQDPRVRTESFLTVSIDGEVRTPGHYLVRSNDPVSAVLMKSGGLTSTAQRGAVRVERGPETVVDAATFETALRAGTSLDQLAVREGDRIFVPPSRGRFFEAVRNYALVIPALIGLLTLF